MFIYSEVETSIYSVTLGKNIDFWACGTVVISKALKPISGFRFTQEIWVENLEANHECCKVMEIDSEFQLQVLTSLINNALENQAQQMENK